jgi:arabinan endo-1,5-alpha-L-arabinosidase
MMKHLSALLFAFAVVGLQPFALHAQKRQEQPLALKLSGAVAYTHDPSIIKDGKTYYVFATGVAVFSSGQASSPSAPSGAAPSASMPQLPIRCSLDLHVWRHCGAVFPDGIPPWIRQASPETKELWAPDISFYSGLYHLYYAYSVFGKNTSGIALATNRTLDQGSPLYKWVDRGLVLRSTVADNFNAIDPSLVLDAKDEPWLTFGSFWSGIKMRRLDAETGLLSRAYTRTYSVAARAKPADAAPAKVGLPPNWEAIEAPFVLRHDAYYYLFVSWDLCCRGTHSTYRTMVGRSASVHGPYVAKDGKPMMQGGGTPLLTGNQRWVGPGGESLRHLKTGDIIVFHAYDAKTGRPAMQISTVTWNNGWPSAALATAQ